MIEFPFKSSGKGGIEEFEDFLDWFGRENPGAPDPLSESPRMVLVGLGVDPRALRIVEFLSDTGVDIQLLTFQAFRAGEELFLARQVETARPRAYRGWRHADQGGESPDIA